MKNTNLWYWIFTGLFAFFMAGGAIPDVFSAQMAVEGFKQISLPKIVFTKTLEKSEWANTLLTKGDLAEEVARLKNQAGKDMIVYGGANFVGNLIDADLIDELHLLIHPVAIGAGLKIFTERTSLTLTHSASFSCGIHLLEYEPAKKNKPIV